VDQIYHIEYHEALEEMIKLRNTVDPLAVIILFDKYPQSILESVVRQLPDDVIEKIDIRLHLICQIINYQRSRSGNPKDYHDASLKKESSNEKYCDFNEVMRLLGRAKGTVESLIKQGIITPVGHKSGKKRRFITADIIKFAEGKS
jgi:hypothetical protein